MKKRTVEYYDWFDLVKEVESEFGIDTDRYRGHRLWNYMIDSVWPYITNDTMNYFDPWELRANAEHDDVENEWVIEIFDMFIKVFEKNGINEGVEVNVSW